MSGGRSNSDSSTNTTAYTTSNVTSSDSRIVASDAAVAVSGSGTAVRNDTTNYSDSRNQSTNMNDFSSTSTSFVDSRDQSSSFTDLSNRSSNFTDNSNRSNFFSDSSNRSTNFDDSSVRNSGNTSFSTTNTTTNFTSTDYGSVAKALDGMGAMGSRALGLSGDAISGAISSLKDTGKNQLDGMAAVLSFAEKNSANSLSTANQILGYAKDTISSSQSAFAEAKDGGTSKNLSYALAAVAVIGVAFALKS